MNLRKALVFRIGHLGDTLVSLPAFWAIKKAFPEASLTLLSNANPSNPNYVLARSILPENGLFDEWLTYPAGGGAQQILHSIKLLQSLRKEKYEAVFYLMTRNRTKRQIARDAAFFRLAGIGRMIGAEYLKRNLLDFTRPRPLPPIASEAEFLLRCLAHEKVPLPAREYFRPELLLSGEERKIASKWLSKNAAKDCKERVLVGVAPGSKWDSKMWAEERFEQVVGRLIAERDVFPVVFGGVEDREKASRLIKQWGRGANACGELNIRQAAAALEHCRFLLGNDSGTMHLAAAVGTPCLAVFASIDWPGRWVPYGSGHRTLRTTIECEGCHLEKCPRNNQCLNEIGVEEVVRASSEFWKNV